MMSEILRNDPSHNLFESGQSGGNCSGCKRYTTDKCSECKKSFRHDWCQCNFLPRPSRQFAPIASHQYLPTDSQAVDELVSMDHQNRSTHSTTVQPLSKRPRRTFASKYYGY